MDDPAEPRLPPRVSLREALPVWSKIGWLGFGGPAGQIALMHRELVERRHWIDEQRFLHALNYCMLLPGPEAQQLATYIGWLMHRTPGGLVAGTLFVLPGVLSILALSVLYVSFHDLPSVAALLFGVKCAVLAVVVEALMRVSKRALSSRAAYVVAALAFVGIAFFDVPFPAIVAGAGVIGFLASRIAPSAFPQGSAQRNAAGEDTPSLIDAMAARGELAHAQPSASRALRVACTYGALWLAPFVAFAAISGTPPVLRDEALFFSKTAVVTFGGAYAVLAYVAQQAVERYAWMHPGEMLDGLGMAETTPGPLIMVLQFVGFLGAYRHSGVLEPMTAAMLGSAVTVWVTFVPCFLWIFLGAPYIEALRGNARLRAALSAITASVVGVIANLSLWFSLHVLFGHVETRGFGPLSCLVPDPTTLDVGALVLAAGAMLAILRFHVGLGPVLAASAALGALYKLAT